MAKSTICFVGRDVTKALSMWGVWLYGAALDQGYTYTDYDSGTNAKNENEDEHEDENISTDTNTNVSITRMHLILS